MSLLSPFLTSITESLLGSSAISRIFARFDPVQNGHGTMQSAVVVANDFRVSALCVLTASATTVSLLGQAASALNYLKVLSTGFASLSIDGSVVTSTVLATKDSQIRTYGVELSGNDFIFQENGVTIDTVTDAVAAAKTLTLDAVAQSNGADFFDGIYADPKITDLVTAANSESWKVDQATGNTEQSSSGNNILTLVFVPEADRGLFTLDTGVTPNRWVGVELVVNGGFDTDLSGWAQSTAGAWAWADGAAEHVGAAGNIRSDSMIVNNNYSVMIDVEKSVGTFRVFVGIGNPQSFITSNGHYEYETQAITNGILYLDASAASDVKVDNVSVKQYIKVAQ